MSDINLTEIHDLLVKVAHQAGKMIMSATPQTLGSDTKKNCTPPLYEVQSTVWATNRL
jgi:myo-inositol-1(or 4)-monophosphatase